MNIPPPWNSVLNHHFCQAHWASFYSGIFEAGCFLPLLRDLLGEFLVDVFLMAVCYLGRDFVILSTTTNRMYNGRCDHRVMIKHVNKGSFLPSHFSPTHPLVLSK